MMNPLPPDPYQILGVAKDASIPDIRAAHRKLVLKCHPDKVQDPVLKEAKKDEFQQVQQAYELLSDENQRQKYDDQVKYLERQKNAAKQTPPRYFNVDIRTAEPRSGSFAGSPPTSKMYAHKQSSKSYEEEIHVGSSARFFEDVSRRARRTASYEKPSRHEERDRERDLQRERERELQREQIERNERRYRMEEEEMARAAYEKEYRRQEKKKADKTRDKERKRETEDKRSRHSKPYVEEYNIEEEVYAVPKVSSEKKKSRKSEEKRESSLQREDSLSAVDAKSKMQSNIMEAANYLSRSRAKGVPPPLGRAHTFASRYVSPPRQAPAVPTPPPAGAAPFPSPPIDDDEVRRSSARASDRRSSHDSGRFVKEKSLHRKTGSGSKEGIGSPIITPGSPPMGGVPEPRPGDLPRASTMNAADFARMVPPPMPGIRRSDTEPADLRGRSRSRFVSQIEIPEASEDERPTREREHRSSGGKHRSSRHKTRSPSPSSYMRPAAPVQRYSVENARSVPIDPWHRDEAIRPKGSKHHGASYVTTTPAKGASYQHVVEVRPSMPPREPSWNSNPAHHPLSKLRYGKHYGEDDIAYSRHAVPQPAYRDEYGSAWARA